MFKKFFVYLFKVAGATLLLCALSLGCMFLVERLLTPLYFYSSPTSGGEVAPHYWIGPHPDVRLLTLWLYALVAAPLLVYWVYFYLHPDFDRFRYALRRETRFAYWLLMGMVGGVFYSLLRGLDFVHQRLHGFSLDTSRALHLTVLGLMLAYFYLGLRMPNSSKKST